MTQLPPATPGATPPARTDGKGVPALVSDLWDLVVTYVKQETIVPLKDLGRFVAAGVAGSVLLSIGLLFWVLAVLRALQTETGDLFEDTFSFAPYLLTLVVAAVVALLAVRSIGKHKRKAR